MKLYIFRCRAQPKMHGASRFETGSNLPNHQCSRGWEFCERVELESRGTLRFAVDSATLLRQVRQNGWYVWDESPRDLLRSAAAESKPISREQYHPPAKPETAASEVLPIPTPMTKMAPSITSESVPARQVTVARTPEVDPTPSVATRPPRHQVAWFDIPVRDLDRAVRFYSAVLGTQLKKEQAGPGVAIAMLPHTDGSVGGCLLQNADAKPSESGPLLYLNTHSRLDEALKAVERHGGRILSAKQSIAPFGFRAIVLDSEGNRVALHSM